MDEVVARLLGELTEAYHGEPWYGRPLRELVDDFDDATGFVRPIAGGHTPAELVRHIAWWKEVVLRRLDDEPVADAAAGDWGAWDDPTPSWHVLVGDLDAVHDRLVGRVARMTAAEMAAPVAGKSHTKAIMVRGVIDHDIYHGGQLAVLARAFAEGTG